MAKELRRRPLPSRGRTRHAISLVTAILIVFSGPVGVPAVARADEPIAPWITPDLSMRGTHAEVDPSRLHGDVPPPPQKLTAPGAEIWLWATLRVPVAYAGPVRYRFSMVCFYGERALGYEKNTLVAGAAGTIAGFVADRMTVPLRCPDMAGYYDGYGYIETAMPGGPYNQASMAMFEVVDDGTLVPGPFVPLPGLTALTLFRAVSNTAVGIIHEDGDYGYLDDIGRYFFPTREQAVAFAAQNAAAGRSDVVVTRAEATADTLSMADGIHAGNLGDAYYVPASHVGQIRYVETVA